MNAPDKSATLAHYAAQAALAELQRWQGKGLEPQEGCGLLKTNLGDADVWVEYEFEPASGDGWNEPRCDAEVTIIGVLINGVMCDAEEVAPHMLDRWAAEVFDDLAAESDAAQCDHYDSLRYENTTRVAT